MEKKVYEAYFDAKDLARYIADSYEKQYKRPISNIKLQKSLYFLFAYWGGFVKRSQLSKNNDDLESVEISKLKPYLFNNRIEAWVYGPVVPSIYKAIKNQTEETLLASINKIKQEPFVKAFIDDLLEDIFNTSDFKLVDLAHQDECWISKFDYNAEQHNQEIDKEEIINEYSTRP